MDKFRQNEAKTWRRRDRIWTKKISKSHFGYKLHSIIDKDYELIRRFKTNCITS
jgi:IS5 family transposase